MFGVALRREIATQAHGDGAGGNFRQTRSDDDARAVDRARQPGGQRKRHSQTVGHADDDVANSFARSEVSFSVSSLWHGAAKAGKMPATRPKATPADTKTSAGDPGGCGRAPSELSNQNQNTDYHKRR